MERKARRLTREFVEYAGRRFWLQSSGRYFQSGVKTDAERLLHRRVWVDNFGPIPDGMEVHHRDDDWRNNDPANLELKSKPQHLRDHAVERWSDPEMAAVMRAGLERAKEAARAWHSTPEGREWHRQNGVQAWAKREIGRAQCRVCAKAFPSPFATRAMYCGTACRNKADRAKHQDERSCVQCGGRFSVFKYLKTECCSRACAVRRLRGHEPTVGRAPALTKEQRRERERAKVMDATCQQCGAAFKYGRDAKRVPKTCSPRCKADLRWGRPKPGA